MTGSVRRARITATGMAVPETVVTNDLLSRCMNTSDEWCLDANGLAPLDVDRYLFHQANLRIIEAATEHFGIPPERCFNNLDRYGNTAAASVPICLHEALSAGRIKDGDLVMLVAFGTGFSWGATLLRW